MIRIGFDWDDVIAPWYAPAHAALVAAGDVPDIQVTDWDVAKQYRISSEEWHAAVTRASHRGEIYAEPPYEEALWAIRSLYWNHPADVEIVIATARSHFPVREEEWLRQTVVDAIQEYAIPCHELLFTKDKREAGCDYFLDDSIRNYWALRESGVAVYLRDQPWNTEAPVPDAFRVGSVTEFVKIIEESL